MNETKKKTELPPVSKRPYEPPMAKFVALRPEERLLVCCARNHGLPCEQGLKGLQGNNIS